MTTVDTTAPVQSSAVEGKLYAEAQKALAEAEAARKLAEFHVAMTERAKLEGEMFAALAHKASTETDNMTQQNVLIGIAADQAKRAEQDELASDRHHMLYNFNRDVSSGSVKECINTLTTWSRKSPGADIEIVFNSPGGAIVDGFALFDFIQLLRTRGHRITTSTLGMAASMAGVLLQAGDWRVMGKQSWLMIHEASFGTIGKIGEVEDTVDWIKMVQERILDIFAERSTMSKTQLRKKWLRKDWWISSDQALELGLVDEVR